MVKTNIETCLAILGIKKRRKIQSLVNRHNADLEAANKLEAQAVALPPLAEFKQKLDEMAGEIDELVRGNESVILYHWQYFDGQGYTDSSSSRERHPLFEKLDIFGPDRYFNETESDCWNDQKLALFRSWVMCTYPGTVVVTVDRPCHDDSDDRSDWLKVEMKWI